VRPWWEIVLALLAMAALGAGCAWWYYRRDFDRGWEAHAAATSPVADEPDDDDATVQWVKDLKEPAALELDDADAELNALAEATIARAIGMGL
jgi:hypothetical protein